MHHYRRTIKRYWQRMQASACPFCDQQTLAAAVARTTHAFVVPNLTKYDLWEGHNVQDHLLVVPKRHVKSFKELSDDERLDIMNLIADYEARGYNIYARGLNFSGRSVEHQHTHAIKAGNKRLRLLVYLRRPYWLFKV